MSQPLRDVRVLELANGVSGPFLGKLFADFGADVLKVEPPGGDHSRHHGPFPADAIDDEQSALFLHLGTNKRSIVADLTTPEGQNLVRSLAPTVDVVIESFAPGFLTELGIGYQELRALQPSIVVTSITPFGQDGPCAQWAGADIVSYAMGGPMWGTGIDEREPVKLGGEVISYQIGQVAAVATLAALTMAQRSGQPTHIDVSALEAQAGTIDRRVAYLLYHRWTGDDCARPPRQPVRSYPTGFFPALDGHVLTFTLPSWVSRMLATLEDEDLARHYDDPDWLANEDLPELAEASLYPWLLDRDKLQAAFEAQRHKWPITPLNAPVDVVEDPHFVERGFFVDVSHPVAGTIRQPGAPFRLGDSWSLRRPAPTLDEHRDEIVEEAKTTPLRRRPRSERQLPLTGLRVVDMTVVWAGAAATMYMGDLGAEVIRVDNPYHFPTATRGVMPRPPRELVPQFGYLSGYPDLDPGEMPWNRHNMFSSHARNKLSCTADPTTDAGREMILRLVEQSDILAENNSIGVLPKLGLDWETLHERNPRLIVLRMPPMGLSGPYADWLGFGASFEALCGLTALRGYPDDDPTSATSVFHMDPASGAGGAFAVMCALRRRADTGVGELIEFPQSENMMQHIGEYLIDAARTGRRHRPGGNRSIARAPQGCYPCAGDDDWVVISVGSDDEWRGLASLVEGATDERFDSAAGRREHHDEIDGLLAAWTNGLSAEDVAERCQRRGVPAGPVLRESALCAHRQLTARDWFREQGSEDQGWHMYPGRQWRWDAPDMPWGPINRLGDANDRVYRDILGLSDLEYQALRDAGQITTSYLDPDGNPL